MQEAGIHFGVPEADYHADTLLPVPTLSSTLARLVLARSPLHAWTAHPRLNPDFEPTEKKTFDIGRAAHRAVLGRGSDYAAYPAEYLASNGAASTKEAKAWAEEQRAEGRTPLKFDEIDQICAMAVSVNRQLAAMGIKLDPTRSEVVALAEVDGVACRAMIDNAPADPRHPLYDLKTTMDASPESLAKTVASYGYDLQAAHYLAVWKAATGEDRRFRIIFVEKEAPYGVQVAELYRKPGDEADWFDHADALAADARRIWGECLRSGQWPGYPARVAVIGAPGWHLTKMEDRSGRAAVSKPTAETVARVSAWQAPEGVN
ncbi:MAG: PD-(D/E)XK nuclease-like domain-containing protein [Rhodobacteraceae bacterium]|nr:PD-(D/E)XK nuclease-like domain-containing protein [Paracoccaceae bacterium]